MDFSFQLYSARNVDPIASILPRLKELGYAQVEGFGGLYADAASLAAAIKSAGMTMPTGHFGLDQLKDTSTALKTAETLGVKTLFCPAIPQDQRSQGEDGWKALAGTLSELAETYKAEGYGFGWHNHDFEFAELASGKRPMEIILDEAPNIDWECDVAWVVRGKQDPLAWIERYADRVVAIHVKDLAPAGECLDEDGWADVGHGTIEWKSMLENVKSKTKAKWFVMEHDKPSDVDRFARRSIEALRQMGM